MPKRGIFAGMSSLSTTFEIRATYDAKRIAVYAAFGPKIAETALLHQQLLPPFSYSRMTWIKPSYLWLMYRSNWAKSAGMERILRIWVKRSNWDAALTEAILTTPEPHVYPDAKKWRKKVDKTRIKVQWDPERNIRNERQAAKSIQVGIMPALAEQYAKKWIDEIEDMTPLTRQVRNLVYQRDFDQAETLLPEERVYPVSPAIRKALGM